MLAVRTHSVSSYGVVHCSERVMAMAFLACVLAAGAARLPLRGSFGALMLPAADAEVLRTHWFMTSVQVIKRTKRKKRQQRASSATLA